MLQFRTKTLKPKFVISKQATAKSYGKLHAYKTKHET